MKGCSKMFSDDDPLADNLPSISSYPKLIAEKVIDIEEKVNPTDLASQSTSNSLWVSLFSHYY